MSLTQNPDLKKLFVYVNFTTQDEEVLKTSIKTLVEKSNDVYKDRIFFLQNTGEIISHGNKFGVSDDLKKQIEGLATDSTNFKSSIKNLTGLDVPVGEAGVITDTSVIGKYVNDKILFNKTIVAPKTDSGITVETSADTAGTTTYTVGLDQSVIVDGKTIVTNGGKLKTAVKLVKKYCADETPTVNSAFFNTKADVTADVTTPVHPVILLTDNAGAILDIVDGNEFVTDGMLDSVSYDEATGTLTFTWNKASGKTDATSIDVKKLFQIENIHTGTKDYIAVKKTNPTEVDKPHEGDVKDGMCYEVNAVVDKTDLTAMSTVTYTPGTPATGTIVDAPLTPATDANYAVNSDFGGNTDVTLGVSGLADAKKVAAKIRAIDEKIAEVGNHAIAREKTITTGIDAKIADLQRQLTEEVTNRGNADATLYGGTIPTDGPASTITGNAAAIATLNADENTAGSVAAKIKALKESLDAEIEYKDANNLVKVAVSQVDGVVTAKENAVTVKTATLTAGVQEDAEYTLDAASPSGYTQKGGYKAKSIEQIAADDPSLVTNQDAWIYGQCIKTQAINAIASDDNVYIKIVREDNKTKVKFEPWTEVHTIGELEKIDEI